jgi:hypothetical protein
LGHFADLLSVPPYLVLLLCPLIYIFYTLAISATIKTIMGVSMKSPQQRLSWKKEKRKYNPV